MAEHTFYSTENNLHHRELTIVNAALLVSKPPTKEKRIRIKVRMILSGQAVTGAPDWISSHHSHVAQWHDPVSVNLDLRGYDLHFSADNLFEQDGVKSPHCQMKSFQIHECGESEAPDIAMTFAIYCPFSAATWQWLGAFGGESCWCSFTPGVPEENPTNPEDDQPMLTSGDDEEEEDEDEDEDAEAEEIDAEDESLEPVGESEETFEDEADGVMLEDAVHVFEQEGKVSIGSLQRVLSINYSKAVGIVDKLEVKGLVSKPDTNGVRVLRAQEKASQKSDAKSLASYHEKVLDAEQDKAKENVLEMPVKRGRGRPRKVDPLTVDAATAF